MLAEMLIKFRTVAEGGLFNKGEGIRMAMELGAKTAGQFDSFHAEPVDPRSKREEAAVMTYPYFILVDQNGKRFVDEGKTTVDEQYEEVARTIFHELPGHIAYMIGDQKMYDIPNYERAVETDKPAIVADTIEELAEKIGVPVGQLTATVESYNAAVQPGEFHWDKKDGNRHLELPRQSLIGRSQLIRHHLSPIPLSARMFSPMAV